MKYKTPYRNLLPGLTSKEFDALKSDYELYGARTPVEIDEDGNVLDGHHRLEIDPNWPTTLIKGLGPEEKEAWVLRTNSIRRNLSPEQRAVVDGHKKRVAHAHLQKRQDDPSITQKDVATQLGVSQRTISTWEDEFITNRSASISYKVKPDSRVKLPKETKEVIKKLAPKVKRGEITQQKIADEHNVTQAAISKLFDLDGKKSKKKRDTKKALSKVDYEPIIYRQDYGDFLAGLEDHHHDLLFTDPPYSTDVDDIDAFALTWVPKALAKLNSKARAYICIGAYPRELKVYLDVLLAQGYVLKVAHEGEQTVNVSEIMSSCAQTVGV